MAEAALKMITVCASCGGSNRFDPQRVAATPEAAKCGRCGKPLFSGQPESVSAEHFQAFVANGDVPVLVDFWAPWCGPCRALAPTLEKVAARISPDIRVAKLNIDEAGPIAERLRIQAVPTLALYRLGRELARTSGVMGEAALEEWVRRAAD